jgi:hypothetical protein
MRESAVGMKCPDCARHPRRAVRPGSPGRYVAAAAAGVGTATLIGILLVVGHIGVFGILVPLIAGFAVGEVVSRMAHRLGGTGFQVIAGVSTAAGLALGALLVGRVPAMLANGPMIVFILIASAVAAIRVGR